MYSCVIVESSHSGSAESPDDIHSDIQYCWHH